jgi:uncharacterized protein
MKAVPDPGSTWPIEARYGVHCFLLLAAVEVLLSGLGRLNPDHGQTSVLLLTLLARLLDLALLWFFLRHKDLHFSDIGLARDSVKRGILYAFIWAMIVIAPWIAFYGIKELGLIALFRSAYSYSGAMYVLVGVLIGPAVEELVFRGWLYGSLRNRFNAAASIAVSSMIFSLAHGIEGFRLVLTFAGGILFSLSYESSKSLMTPIILHIGGNAFLKWFTSIILS